MVGIEDAIQLAVQAHKGQVDKAGRPYILHPLRVMFRLEWEMEKIVGVLHDMIEDTEYSLIDLRKLGYSEEILEALDCLTKREDESYDEFIERARANQIAKKVKIADLEDNMDLTRLTEVTEKDMERLRKYRRSWAQLQVER